MSADVPGRARHSVVRLPAEVDLGSASEVRDALLSAVNRGSVHLVVDATRTRFLDSSGLNALVRARERTDRLGGSLHLVTSCPAVLRVLALSQLDRVIAVVPTLAEAQRCTSHPETIHTCTSRTGPTFRGGAPGQGRTGTHSSDEERM